LAGITGTLSVLRTLADKDVRDSIHIPLGSVPRAIFGRRLFCYARSNQTDFFHRANLKKSIL
jgi:hypothetical protein